MPRSLSKSKVEDFEPKKRNPLGLLDDSNLDSDLKTLLIGGEPTGIELSETKTRINTSLEVDQLIGNIKSTGGLYINDGQKLVFNNNSFVETMDFGGTTYMESSTLGVTNYLYTYVNNTLLGYFQSGGLAVDGFFLDTGNIGIPINSKLSFDGAASQEYITGSGTSLKFYTEGTLVLTMKEEGKFDLKNDYTLDATTDNVLDFLDSTVSVFKVETASISVPAENKILLDGSGGHTYLQQSADNVLEIVVGGDLAFAIRETVSASEIHAVSILETWKLAFDGGGIATYIQESSADILDIYVGGDNLLKLSEKGADGNEIAFDGCVGFTQKEPTYDATNTEVDFRFSNKQFVTFNGGSITNLKLIFPLVSGNFVLLVKQDGFGSRTITNYKAMESDGSAADGAAAVKFAGGSNPTLTTDANHVDILSFYWDADNEIAYGVATLDFQF